MNKLSSSFKLLPIILPHYNFRIKSKEFSRSGEDFTIWFMEGILEENPNYFDCLLYLGNAYTNTGRYEDGLRIDLKLAKLRREDPIVRYNLACSYSLVGDVDSAIRELETSVALGYKDIQHMEEDKDLEKLREDKRYQELIGRAKRSMAEVRDKDNK